MWYLIISIVTVAIIVIVARKVSREKKKRLIKKIEELKEKYPLASVQYFSKNHVSINSANNSTLERILSRPANVWGDEEQLIVEEQRKKEELRKKEEEETRRKKEEEEAKQKAELEKYKPKKDEIMKILQDNGIMYLYHFTARENIPSIKALGGLYSWAGLCSKVQELGESNRRAISNHQLEYCIEGKWYRLSLSSDEKSRCYDEQSGLEDYVRLSFTPNHPMMFTARNEGRVIDPVVLKIKVDVAALKETLYSNKNATIQREPVNVGESIDDLKQVHFGTVRQKNHFDLDDYERSFYQAEVMVKSFIPVEYIINLDNPIVPNGGGRSRLVGIPNINNFRNPYSRE